MTKKDHSNPPKKTKQNTPLDLVEQVANEDSIETIEETIEMVRKEYGEFKISKEMRKELEKELGVDSEVANGWQKVSDILDHIDIYELAKKHPGVMGKISRGIASIVGFFVAPVGRVADKVPDEIAAKIIGLAGFLTPEHLLNMVAKGQVKRAKRKHEQNKLKEQESKDSEELNQEISQDAEELNQESQIPEEPNQDKSQVDDLSQEPSQDPKELHEEIIFSPENAQKEEFEQDMKIVQEITENEIEKGRTESKTWNETKPGDPFVQIQKAKEMLDCGIITEEEFSEIKSKLIAGL